MTTPQEATAPWDGKLYSDGWSVGSGPGIDVVSPGDGTKIASLSGASVADLDDAVASANRAQRAWAAAPYSVRAGVLLTASRLLADDPGRLMDILVAESGSAGGKAGFEVGLVVSELQEAAALASHPSGQVLRSVKQRMSLARRVPLGTVGVIAPFNFPAILAMRSVAPALALGNAVVLKPDPRTSISGGLALALLLEEAGLPDGLFHVLPGGGDVGAALVVHPDVPCITFTGSTAAGRRIGEAAGPLLKRVHLELGGNNAMLVLPDADIEAAAGVGAWGSFLHQGQICMTTGRHLVPKDKVEEYVRLLSEKASRLPLGNPTDPANALGPLIDEGQRDHVAALVERARSAGATVDTGGSFEGLYYAPTVISGLTIDNPAWTEEIFGPVAPVIGYDTVQEAIDIINASEYGLAVSIITTNPYAAIELCDLIDSGAIHINDSTVDDEAVIPFGGSKASGAGGRFGGPQANLDTFTETQWVTVQSNVERYPF